MSLKLQEKITALPFNGMHLYIAFVQHHNLLAKAKPYTATGLLSAEERNEYFVNDFFRHTDSIVRNFQNNFPTIVG